MNMIYDRLHFMTLCDLNRIDKDNDFSMTLCDLSWLTLPTKLTYFANF